MPKVAAVTAFLLLAGTSTVAFADEPPTRKQKKKDGCSVAVEDDAVLGLAALVLLVSGAALRRRGEH